jgi:hypothetical protein
MLADALLVMLLLGFASVLQLREARLEWRERPMLGLTDCQQIRASLTWRIEA